MTIDKNEILNAYYFRHACKKYDETKKIRDTDFQCILDVGRLSPSSFGLEPWQFLVIENSDIKKLIRDNAWGAKDKVMECSHFIVILARQHSTLFPDSEYIERMMKEVHHLPDEIITLRQGFYRKFSQSDFNLLANEHRYYDWATKQCYIALGNMLTTAAMLGIDSTPIEGFPLEKMDRLFAEKGLYDPKIFKLSVMAAFGYRLNPPKEKTRQPLNDVVKWVK